MSRMSESVRDKIAKRRRIYLVRHGDVDYFDGAGRPKSEKDIGLNDRGIGQAAAIAAALIDTPLDCVVTSGLRRAEQTAAYILEPREISTVQHPDLREIMSGPVEALHGDEFKSIILEALHGDCPDGEPFLGGETYGAHRQRVLRVFEAIVSSRDWNSLAIVAHGGTNRAILSHALGAGSLAFGHLEQDAGCLNVIDVDDDQSLSVRLVNFTPLSVTKKDLVEKTMENVFLRYFSKDADGAIEL